MIDAARSSDYASPNLLDFLRQPRMVDDPATTDTVVPVDDTELPADVVIIIGVGVTPNVELARSCGLNVDNGILTG